MKERINQLLQEIGLCVAATVEEAEALRIKYLSKKGEIARLFDDFRLVPSEEKKQIGQMLNELKNKAQEHINSLRVRAQASFGRNRPDTNIIPDETRNTPSDLPGEAGDLRDLCPPRLQYRRRAGDRGRLACILFDEFRRRPSCS